MRLQLRDEERALIRRRSDKQGYVALVQFRGPRGRTYRPVRGEVRVTEERAREDVVRIRQRQYAHGAFATTDQVLVVDQLGNVIE